VVEILEGIPGKNKELEAIISGVKWLDTGKIR